MNRFITHNAPDHHLTLQSKNRYDECIMNSVQSNNFSFLRENPSLNQSTQFQSAFQRTFRTPSFSESPTTQPSVPVTHGFAQNSGSVFQPKLLAIYAAVFFLPIVAALIYRTSTQPKTTALAQQTATEEAMTGTQTTLQPIYVQEQSAGQQATLTSAQQSPSETYEYELSLSNSFLRKAIELSNKAEQQTPNDKAMIVQYLNQALEAANRAISANETDPRGYSARGRVYQATSSIKPEMKQLADADFAKATELGAQNPTQSPSQTNPIDHIPTEQATNTQADASVIAAPEETQQSTVTTETNTNTKQGTATIASQSTEVFVPYAETANETRIYVEEAGQSSELVLYIKNKQAGVGFTIATTSAPTSDTQVTWKIVE